MAEYKTTFQKLNEQLDALEKNGGKMPEKKEEPIDKSFKGFCKRNYGYIIAFFCCLVVFVCYLIIGRPEYADVGFFEGLRLWIGDIWIIILSVAVLIIIIGYLIKYRK